MTKANSECAGPTPRSLLLLKGHSAGIGDLLRSSAAWRALRNHFPAAQLHLWFLTQDPGAASEELIARHHLLSSFRTSDKRTHGTGWQRLLREARLAAQQTQPDLVIDFEPNGIRTSLLTWYAGWRARATTVGINQVPFRGWFYRRTAPSTKAYAQRCGLPQPLEYAERDFVALAALGIGRGGTPIELQETPEGSVFRRRLYGELGLRTEDRLLGINIGCGTPDAVAKRPDLDLLRSLVGELQHRHGYALVLTGAPFEREVNRQFLAGFRSTRPVIDLAGRTNLLELAGAIAACSLFVSSDSGPYHMAVALRVPTLSLFRFGSPEHYHREPWVECHVTGGVESLPAMLAAAERLRLVMPPPRPEPGSGITNAGGEGIKIWSLQAH